MKYEIGIERKAGKKIPEKWVREIIKIVFGKTRISRAEISVAFVGNREIKKLNKQYRKKNKTTDVLSFLYDDEPLTGEIVICYPRAALQAKEHGWSARQEIKLLLVHGLLHLAGYDHEKSQEEARKMERLQEKILKFLK